MQDVPVSWSTPDGFSVGETVPRPVTPAVPAAPAADAPVAASPSVTGPIRFQPQLAAAFDAVAAALPARRHLCVAGPVGCGQGFTARLLRDRLPDGAALRRVIPADLLDSSTAVSLDRLRRIFAESDGGVLYLAELESLYSDQNAVPLLATFRECLKEFPDVSVVLAGDVDAVSRLHALNPDLFARFTHVEVRSFTIEEMLELLTAMLHDRGLELAPGFATDAAEVLRRIRSVGSMRNARILAALCDVAEQQSADRPVRLGGLDLSRLRPLTGISSDGFEELDGLIGLTSVKATVRLWVANASVNARREQLGLLTSGMGQHMVFKGPAGTAKTTVARIVGKILTETGVLSSGHLVEVQRADLIGDTPEQSARRTVEVVKRALGGVLFIDEAYTLTSDTTGRDSGREIVDTLLKMMEDYREEFVVVVAGYPLEMEQFLNSNPGLRSRFVRVLEFPAYDPEELLAIMDFLAASRGYRVDPAVGAAFRPRLALVSQYPGFGNGRHVRNLLEAAISRQATRVTADSSDEDLRTLLLEDFIDPAAVNA